MVKLTKPVVNPEVWKEVPDEHVPSAVHLGKVNKRRDRNPNTQIRKQHKLSILRLIKRTRRVKVVHTPKPPILLSRTSALLLQLVVIVARNVGDEVKDPSTELLTDKVDESRDWGLLGQLVELVNHAADAGGVDFASFWHKHHVLIHVTGGLVVLSVGDLPGEIWHQKCGVADPADGVVDDLGWGESLVSALVSEDPDTGTEETLNHGIHAPEHSADWSRWDSLWGNVSVECPECSREAGKVAGDIRQRKESVALEAVLWNGADDVAHGVVWDLELVAVGIEQLLLLNILGLGAHAGERGGGWGLAWGIKWRGGGGGGRGDGRSGRSAAESLVLRNGGGCHCVDRQSMSLREELNRGDSQVCSV